jgi:hypothetical protein
VVDCAVPLSFMAPYFVAAVIDSFGGSASSFN